MPAARYWRINGITTYAGGDLELSDIALYSGGVRVDGSATFTSTLPPISAGRWAAADVRRPGFALQWDFGVAQEVDDVQFTLPSGAAQCDGYEVQYLVGSDWVFAFHWSGSTSGNPQIQQYADPLFQNVYGLWNFTGYNTKPPEPVTYPSSCKYRLTCSDSATDADAGALSIGSLGIARLRSTSSNLRIPSVGFNGDFCFEIRYAKEGSTTNTLNSVVISFGAGFPALILNTSSSLPKLAIINGANTVVLQGTIDLSVFSIHHVAWVRKDGVHKLFVNGVAEVATWVDATTYSTTELATTRSGYLGLHAVVDYLRVTYGAARYETNFTAPAGGELPGFPPRPLRPSVAAPPTPNSEYTPPATVTPKPAPAPNRIDIAYGGTATVAGTVKKVPNVPLRRRVRLYDENGRQFIREVWSDAVSGEFVFTELNPAYAYTVVTYDYENNYRALTVDKVVAV